ncbi:Plasmodium exported protein, unknown function [Plasmodium ovale]|uniref:Uncharacterized protein n=1 Tax=Plasmodium ovale TaxID=36330 RepID=A0A1C3KFW7_PLAOA|nr:Plasmodium exported protein, unknown function [Plasmodium ovale]
MKIVRMGNNTDISCGIEEYVPKRTVALTKSQKGKAINTFKFCTKIFSFILLVVLLQCSTSNNDAEKCWNTNSNCARKNWALRNKRLLYGGISTEHYPRHFINSNPYIYLNSQMGPDGINTTWNYSNDYPNFNGQFGPNGVNGWWNYPYQYPHMNAQPNAYSPEGWWNSYEEGIRLLNESRGNPSYGYMSNNGLNVAPRSDLKTEIINYARDNPMLVGPTALLASYLLFKSQAQVVLMIFSIIFVAYYANRLNNS